MTKKGAVDVEASPIKVLYRASQSEGNLLEAAAAQQQNGPGVKQSFGGKLAATDPAVLQKELQEMHQQQERWLAERRRLQEELKDARAGQRRAEELLVAASREAGSVKEAKARSEEAFLRALRELQACREERDEATHSANQLLADMIVVQEQRCRLEAIVQRLMLQLAALSPAAAAVTAPCSHELSSVPSTAAGSSAGDSTGGSAGSVGHLGDSALHMLAGSDSISSSNWNSSNGGSNGGGLALSVPGQVSLQASNKKNRNLKQVLKELQMLREAKNQAESQKAGLQEELQRLRREKEMVEESSDMVTRQTQVLLADKLALVSKIEAKDELARQLEGGLHQLAHQLECALSDRAVLLQQLAIVSPQARDEFAGSDEGGTSGELPGPVPELAPGLSEGEELLQRVLGLGLGLGAADSEAGAASCAQA